MALSKLIVGLVNIRTILENIPEVLTDDKPMVNTSTMMKWWHNLANYTHDLMLDSMKNNERVDAYLRLMAKKIDEDKGFHEKIFDMAVRAVGGLDDGEKEEAEEPEKAEETPAKVEIKEPPKPKLQPE